MVDTSRCMQSVTEVYGLTVCDDNRQFISSRAGDAIREGVTGKTLAEGRAIDTFFSSVGLKPGTSYNVNIFMKDQYVDRVGSFKRRFDPTQYENLIAGTEGLFSEIVGQCNNFSVPSCTFGTPEELIRKFLPKAEAKNRAAVFVQQAKAALQFFQDLPIQMVPIDSSRRAEIIWMGHEKIMESGEFLNRANVLLTVAGATPAEKKDWQAVVDTQKLFLEEYHSINDRMQVAMQRIAHLNASLNQNLSFWSHGEFLYSGKIALPSGIFYRAKTETSDPKKHEALVEIVRRLTVAVYDFKKEYSYATHDNVINTADTLLSHSRFTERRTFICDASKGDCPFLGDSFTYGPVIPPQLTAANE